MIINYLRFAWSDFVLKFLFFYKNLGLEFYPCIIRPLIFSVLFYYLRTAINDEQFFLSHKDSNCYNNSYYNNPLGLYISISSPG